MKGALLTIGSGTALLALAWTGFSGTVKVYPIMLGTLLVVLGLALVIHGHRPRQPSLLLRIYSSVGLILGLVQLRYLKYFEDRANLLVLPITLGLIVVLWMAIPRQATNDAEKDD